MRTRRHRQDQGSSQVGGVVSQRRMLADSSIIVDHDGGNRHKRLYKRAGVLVGWQPTEAACSRQKPRSREAISNTSLKIGQLTWRF